MRVLTREDMLRVAADPPGMVLDGAAATQARDSSNEDLVVEGCDISSLLAGEGYLNYEHLQPEDQGEERGAWREVDPDQDAHLGDELVGRIVYARKILGEQDLEDDRQHHYWIEAGRLPFLYIVGYLYDQAGHRTAQSLAAILRGDARAAMPPLLRWSIEGQTLDRDPARPHRLTSTICRGVTLTRRPCNKTALSGVMADPGQPSGWVVKSEPGPGRFRVVGGAVGVLATPLEKKEREEKKLPRTPRVEAAPRVSGSTFDEQTGTLHTPKGSWRVHVPSQAGPDAARSFQEAVRNPSLRAFHARAMENWQRVHSLLRVGRLPDEVLMHATLFSQLSPNNPVPNQELMYSHLVDTMRDRGLDARDPRFRELFQDWTGRDRPQGLPRHSRKYFEKLRGVRVGRKLPGEGQQDLFGDPVGKPTGTGRYPGDVVPFGRPNQTFAAMSRYHEIHQALSELVGRHREDARSAVDELMQHKDAADRHEARRKREVQAGRPDPGPYDGPVVYGLAPKTTRYLYGMLGGGNVVVPDTHFVRHVFGLDLRTQADQIDHVKSVLWDEKNSPVLAGLDRYYARHHDAIREVQDDPRLRHLFAQNPEQAIFPAFWLHWLAVPDDERRRGMPNRLASNQETDHTPFWEAVDPLTRPSWLGKAAEGAGQDQTAAAAATVHRYWADRYGDGTAMALYWAYLVPVLLRAALDRLTPSRDQAALEGAAVEARAATLDGAVRVGRHLVRPGRARTARGPYALLWRTDRHGWLAVPEDRLGDYRSGDLVRLPYRDQNRTYRVESVPAVLAGDDLDR